MMTPERPAENHDRPPGPRRYVDLGPEARSALSRLLGRLERPEIELQVLQGVADHGAGFVAWLRLDDTAPEEPTLITRYEQSYAGAWDSIDAVVTDLIDALGWREELAEMLARNAIPDGYLRWNHSAIYGRLYEMYDFIELDGLTHAFTR